ncbi:MAG TPA: phosphoribosyltransferase family protein [Actinomycetes bacterium]
MDGYADRAHAGRVLATHLADVGIDGNDAADMVVLGLPRGGVVVAAEVAARLGVQADAFVVRKLGVPGHEELAMGAIATGGVRVLNEDVVADLRIPPEIVDAVTEREEAELARRERSYRGGREPPKLSGRTVVLVDDGLATGATMRAAVEAVRAQSPARLVVAVPVAPPDTVARFSAEGVEVLCPLMPRLFGGVGQFYGDFSQTTDDEVRAILSTAD